jgi:hypothetical protein
VLVGWGSRMRSGPLPSNASGVARPRGGGLIRGLWWRPRVACPTRSCFPIETHPHVLLLFRLLSSSPPIMGRPSIGKPANAPLVNTTVVTILATCPPNLRDEVDSWRATHNLGCAQFPAPDGIARIVGRAPSWQCVQPSLLATLLFGCHFWAGQGWAEYP